MRRMKICITTLEFPPDTGGVGESVKRISGMLKDEGHEIHIFVFHASRQHESDAGTSHDALDTYEQDGVIVHRFRHVERGSRNSSQDLLSDVYIALNRLHVKENFDLFHSFFLNEIGFLTTLLAHEVGRPVINSIRGADIHKNIFNSKIYSQVQWAMENSSWLTFVSAELERRAHILAPSTRGKTSAFWNSIVPLDFAALRKPQVNGDIRGIVIGSFGNFRNKKGIEPLIRACSQLAAEIELTLLMVGDFVAKEKDYWNGFIEDHRLADRVIVTGKLSREEALAYHRVVDIFAIPSLRDGCPNALMEAMLAGQAIVGSSVDAIGEILDDGLNGLVVEPGATDELVNALKRLADDPLLRERLGKAAREKALRDLAPARERDNWLRVYDRVISTREPVYLGAAAANG